MDALIARSCQSGGAPPPPPPPPPSRKMIDRREWKAPPNPKKKRFRSTPPPMHTGDGDQSKRAQRQKATIDRNLLVRLMKSHGKLRDANKARLLYSELRETTRDIYTATALLSMLAKCGAFEEAKSILDRLPKRNVVSWNALISGYVQHGHHDEALSCFRQMCLEGVTPSAVTFICILKACASIQSLEIGEGIHKEVKENGLLEKETMLATALLNMYAKCGVLEKAQEVFEGLPVRNVVSWSALIAGYVQHGHGQTALECFKRMKDDGVSPNAITFTCILKACGSLKCVELGKEIHAEVKAKGLLEKDILLGNTLVDMYAKCGVLEKAQEVFEELPRRDVVSWNTLISGYTQHGHGDAALQCFRRMWDEGISLDVVSFICAMKACGSTGCLEMGEVIHAKLKENRWLEKDIVLGTALVDMYSKCGALEKAREVFIGLPEQSVVSWNALTAGYVQHGHGEAALGCFRRMQDEGISPDGVSFASILKACGSIGSLEIGYEVHAQIKDQGLLENDIVLATALLDMYAKCGVLVKAQEAFEQFPERNVVVWSALIAGYVQHGYGDTALECFRKMQDEGISPNFVTFISVLKACGIIGCLEIGETIHENVKQQGLLENDIVLGNALVDMYAKCGSLQKAQEVFEDLPTQGVVAWNALICGQSQMGQAKQVFKLFNKMRADGIFPDLISFLILLSACSHAGLVEEAQVIFDSMCDVYHFSPELEHVSCMVDLFGRAGRFDKVRSVLDKLPSMDYLPVFAALLGACCKWVNVEFGIWAFEKLVQLDGQRAASYVCMRNIYDAAGMHGEAVPFSISEGEMWQAK